jgi:opacity protein-like surface antigen
MKRKFFLIPLYIGFLSHAAVAGTMGSEKSWVASLSLGPAWENAGTTQTFYLAPDIEKSYVADKATNALFDGEVFLGIQKMLPYSLQGQLGLAVAATSNAALSGVILDDAGPEFNNYSYSYKIQHTHIAAKAKVLFDRGYWLMPWVSGSIGVGFNYAHSFENTPLIYEAIPTPNFTSEMKTSFTYTVGAGVQKALSQQWQVGVGYEFADWGQSSLGRASGQTLNSGLSLNHLYTNGLMFNLTYVA